MNFIWITIHHSLPTKKNLTRRGMIGSPICTRYWNVEGTLSHILRDCSFARRYWFASQLSLRTESAENTYSSISRRVFVLLRRLLLTSTVILSVSEISSRSL
ncbi:hypothetical protein PIB30_058406 [Stylosanthes scabra]|uniref:Reverse transcriptase zinc-binding domain-containing protein n=1 Tax=Stylosanthes scabra TaxID=79078 RepID=A0ABU6RKJ3_9FABA|nr:hypothetical protein [Stylosanthes scabra]